MSIGIEFCHTIQAHIVKPISKSLLSRNFDYLPLEVTKKDSRACKVDFSACLYQKFLEQVPYNSSRVCFREGE